MEPPKATNYGSSHDSGLSLSISRLHNLAYVFCSPLPHADPHAAVVRISSKYSHAPLPIFRSFAKPGLPDLKQQSRKYPSASPPTEHSAAARPRG